MDDKDWLPAVRFIGEEYVVTQDPYSSKERWVIMKRKPGSPNMQEVVRILTKLKMCLVGVGGYRRDGLWYHYVEEINE